MHPFSTPQKCFQGVEKGRIGNEWVNVTFTIIISFYYLLCHIYDHLLPCYLLIPTQDKNQNRSKNVFLAAVKRETNYSDDRVIYSYQLNLISKYLFGFHVFAENIIQRCSVKKISFA